MGYNFLYINRVARPGDQMNPVDRCLDRAVQSPTYGDFGQVPGTPLLFVQDEFWLHGVNFGFAVQVLTRSPAGHAPARGITRGRLLFRVR